MIKGEFFMHLRLIRLSGVFKLYYLSGIKTKEQTLSDYFIINCEKNDFIASNDVS